MRALATGRIPRPIECMWSSSCSDRARATASVGPYVTATLPTEALRRPFTAVAVGGIGRGSAGAPERLWADCVRDIAGSVAGGEASAG
jgi:hypothetical protein